MVRATRKKKSIKRNSRKRTPKNTRHKKHKKTMYGGAGFMKALARRLAERNKRRKRKAGKTRGSKPPPRLKPSKFSNNEGEEKAYLTKEYNQQMNNEKKQYNENVESWWQQWKPYTLSKDPNYVYGWKYYNALKPYWTTKDIFGREVAIYTKPERTIEPGHVIYTGEGDGPWTKVDKDFRHAGGIIPVGTKIIVKKKTSI